MLQDLRFTLRTLTRAPGFVLVAVLTLAVGIGANTAVFSLLDALYFRPLPLENIDELAEIASTSPRTAYGIISYPEFLEIAENTPAFQNTVADGRRGVVFHQGGEAQQMLISFVSGHYFDTLGIPLHLGRGFVPEEADGTADAPAVVINHHLWREKLAGRSDVIGSTIQLNDNLFTVVGVTAPGFPGLGRTVRTDVWVSTGQAQFVRAGFRRELSDRHYRWFRVYGRLAEGAGIDAARAQLNTLARRWQNDDPKRYHNAGLVVEGFAAGHRQTAQQGFAFLGLIGLVLLIACANVANLTLARSEVRRRELVVRAAIGAGRGRLIRQLLTESSVLAGFGAALGLLLGSWLIRLFPAFVPPGVVTYTISTRLDERVLLYTLAATVLSALMVGIVPALRSSRADLATGLKDEVASRTSVGRVLPIRDMLVVAQIAVCVLEGLSDEKPSVRLAGRCNLRNRAACCGPALGRRPSLEISQAACTAQNHGFRLRPGPRPGRPDYPSVLGKSR